MTQKLYAFWHYDLFPHVLGGEITAIDKDGDVETVGFGKGHWFKPFKIVPLEEGRRIAKNLDDLRQERRVADQKLSQEFLVKRNAILKVPTR